MIAPPENKIFISPIGDLDLSLIGQVSKVVSQTFAYRTESISLLKDIGFALDPARNQYYSTMVLEKLAILAPLQTIKLLAICEVDLFIPILTHVYGEAQLGGKICIISTHRLNDDLPPMRAKNVYYQRVIKEAIHELGHTFNLRHCPDKSCSMHYCRTIKDVDNKTTQFCRYCKILLEDTAKNAQRTWP